MNNINLETVKKYFLNLQINICNELEKSDNKEKFITDNWKYKSGKGGGITRVLTNGNIFEKAGVNFSHIQADKLPASILKMRPELEGYSFDAMGVSLVIHPENPFIPTSHANVRFFLATKENEKPVWWFGGGYDLTPYYGFKEDCIFWHKVAKDSCNGFGENIYNDYKKQCDEYFFLPHRNESRGIGGLFFDYLTGDFSSNFLLVQSIGNSFTEAYIPIVEKRKDTQYNAEQKDFQLYRRGRYVEFNLLFDRGTHFGIQSNGRTESILMSLPPNVKWGYKYIPDKGSAEDKLTEDFLGARNWVDM